MKKFLTLLILPLMFAFFFPVSVSAETKAGIGPSSFFYIFDTTFENINLFFTFNSEKKAKKALIYANERLAEAEESANKNEPKAVKKAMEGYKKKISLAVEKSKELKDEKKSEELFNTISESTIKHKKVLEDILEKVPDEAKEAILKAIEISKQGQEKELREISTFKEEAVETKEELKENESDNIDKKDTGNENDEIDEVGKLRKEVEALKKLQEAQKIAETAAKKKREAEALLAQQRKIEEQKQEIEKLKAEKKEEDEEIKKDESKFLTLPNGAIVEMDENKNFIKIIKEAPTLPTQTTKTISVEQPLINDLFFEQAKSQISYYQKIISEWQEKYQSRKKLSQEGIQTCNNIYNNRIQWAQEDGDREITAMREKSRGFVNMQRPLDLIRSQTERKIEELEYEKIVCVAKYYVDTSVPLNLSKLSNELSLVQKKLNKSNSIIVLNEIELIGTRIIYTVNSLGY